MVEYLRPFVTFLLAPCVVFCGVGTIPSMEDPSKVFLVYVLARSGLESLH